MKPIDFVVFDGDSSPNMAVYKLFDALNKDVRIFGPDGEYEVLSYYISDDEEDGQMFLDIQKKGISNDQ